ncbi:ferredoxin (plasmid) [Streptomyces sp. Qhu-G9]|uniref:ferredoxin n=1 Tax=Streptomyces sp. Qhu-G9 TaxID=3452799 RepID=UPI0022AC19DB|nr:ferredoxin [Streptomyces aurantiacus]WAU78454.1 ferredoxin [Streptomyces aurantiacus]
MTLYFDPVTTVRSRDHNAFRGCWEDRLWLNVPGPFYGGETDTCWTGRLAAPAHVLYGGEYLTEYVYRQPRTPAETTVLVDAAGDDPFGGYGCDGDSRWTPEAVREWWRNRGQVLQYLSDQRSTWDESDAAQGQDIAAAVRDFESYIGGRLASDLQIYLYWLEKRQSPDLGDRLPEL